MKGNTRRSLLTVAMALCWSPALAHPPYERLDRVLSTESGESVYLVRAYMDGILGSDPVKLVVRDARGKVLAETDYRRDVSLLCLTAARCLVFQFDGALPVLPARMYRLNGGSLARTGDWWLVPVGVLDHVWNHLLGYAIALGVIFVVVAVHRRADAAPPGAARTIKLAVVFVVGGIILFFWFYVLLILTELSLPIAVALFVVMLMAARPARRARAWILSRAIGSARLQARTDTR
jgi:hypothetical protein